MLSYREEDPGVDGSILLRWIFRHRVLVGRSEGKRPLRRPRRRWEYTIKKDFQVQGFGGEI